MANQDARDRATLDFYRTQAPVYTASGPGGVSRFLPDFMERLEPGSKVLELGCGGGRDSEAMIARGFEVTPTDGSPEIARQAEQRLGRPVRVMAFDEIDFTDNFDAVWANASLLHVPRPALPRILGLVHRALKPGGLHFANYKAGGTEGRDEHGRYFNFLSLDQAQEIYAASGSWQVIETREYMGGGYRQGKIPWVAVTMQKPG